MEDVQNELRRKYEIVFKPAVLWPNINFSLRTFTAFVGVLAKKKFANLHERNCTEMQVFYYLVVLMIWKKGNVIHSQVEF